MPTVWPQHPVQKARYAVIRIEVPKVGTSSERELLKQLAAESAFNPRVKGEA